MPTNEEVRDAYLDAVADHLRPIIAARSWSVELGVVLAQILQLQVIEFVDGFVANAEGDDPVRILGVSEAAMIVARVASHGSSDWQWWRTRSMTGVGLKFEPDDYERVLQSVRDHPSVRRVD